MLGSTYMPNMAQGPAGSIVTYENNTLSMDVTETKTLSGGMYAVDLYLTSGIETPTNNNNVTGTTFVVNNNLGLSRRMSGYEQTNKNNFKSA